MRLRTPLALLGAAVLVLVGPPLLTTGSGTETGTQIPGLRLMVPNTPGGGYDITARTAAKNAEDAGLTHNIEVFNLPGAGGTVGLSRLVSEHGNGKLAMSMGLGVVGAVRSNGAPKTLGDTTPIARLTEEQDVVVVAKDSPYKTIDDLIGAWRNNPGKLPVGGGSSPGGPDHLAPMLMARAAGIAPKQVTYIPFDGGGELLASILGNKVGFGVSGVGEYLDQIKAGELRLLAVTGPERIPGLDAPTLREAGYDVNFTNWRGLVAPPGLTDAERDKLVALVEELHDSDEWRTSMKQNGWDDAFLTGEKFGDFLKAEDKRVVSVLKELGLWPPTTDLTPEPATERRSWLRDHSELGVCALLLALGVLVLTDALTMDVDITQRGPVGPRTVPVVIGVGLLLVAALLAVDVLRGGRGQAEAGEDVDLSEPADWRTVLLLAGVFLGSAVLIEPLGFPGAGALLFWGAAFALGSRRFDRDPLIAAVVSLVSYTVFNNLLGVPLPGGPLRGVL